MPTLMNSAQTTRAACDVCGDPATVYIRSTEKRFSSPRCDAHGHAAIDQLRADGARHIDVNAVVSGEGAAA